MKKTPENVVKMNRYRGVNEATGDPIAVDMPATRGRRRKGKRKMFAMVDLESLAMLELSTMEWEVLNVLMAMTNQETGEARIHIREIAKRKGRPESSVSRTMKSLVDRQIVFALGTGAYRVNAWLMFRGSVQDWDAATDVEVVPVWRRA